MLIPAWLRSFTVLMAWIFGVIVCWEITKAFSNLLNGKPKEHCSLDHFAMHRPKETA